MSALRTQPPIDQSAPAAASSHRSHTTDKTSGSDQSDESSPYADLTIGVLALQGAFIEHVRMIELLGAQAREVRLPDDLEELHGLIVPGGESTTIGKLLVEFDLLEPLREWVRSGRPIYGTCAGAILLARDIGGLDQPLIGLLDVTVQRNAFGRQLQSFEADLPIPRLGAVPLRAVFIRAPAILTAGPAVEVLASLPDGRIVAAEQGPILVSCFHPELTADTRFHRHFLDLVRVAKLAASRCDGWVSPHPGYPAPGQAASGSDDSAHLAGRR